MAPSTGAAGADAGIAPATETPRASQKAAAAADAAGTPARKKRRREAAAQGDGSDSDADDAGSLVLSGSDKEDGAAEGDESDDDWITNYRKRSAGTSSRPRASRGANAAAAAPKDGGGSAAAVAGAAPAAAAVKKPVEVRGPPPEFASKLKVLLAELEDLSANSPESKVLVFSQFQGTLELLKTELTARQFGYRTLTGNMSRAQRSKALKDFQHDPPTTVFLLSTRAGAVGINLTQANHVFLMEPCFNAALERQVSRATGCRCNHFRFPHLRAFFHGGGAGWVRFGCRS